MSRAHLIVALIICMLPASVVAQSWPDLSTGGPKLGGGGKDAAVVVGIDDYAFAPDVPGAADNAQAWAYYFNQIRGVPIGRISMMLNSQATKEDLEVTLQEAAARVKPGGTFWFVFIGHGAATPDGKEGVLVGADAKGTARSLYARGLTRTRVLELVGNGAQARSIFVLDTCFSGRTGDGDALARGVQPLVPVAGATAPRNTIFLTAGRGDEFAGALPGAGRPAFSYLLLGALRGWADEDGDGKVTATEARDYTAGTLQFLLGGERSQTPELWADKPGVVLAAGRRLERGPDVLKLRAAKAPAAPRRDFAEADTFDPGSVDEVVVAFSSTPAGAVVMVDGKLACEATPCPGKAVPSGRRKVTFHKDRYVLKSATLALANGKKVDWALEEDFGTIAVATEPPGVPIMLNGKPAGTTPLTGLELAPGKHKLTVKDRCWLALEKWVEVKRGNDARLTLDLKPRTAGLKVTAKDSAGNDLVANVHVDGVRIGATPGRFKVGVCATREVKVTLEEHSAFIVRPELSAGETTVVEALLDRGQALFADAMRHYYGQGAPANKSAAAELFGDACEGGYTGGCANLGFLYDRGEGVPQNKGEAARLYQQGCTEGIAGGCANLGLLYAQGDGVSQSHENALRYYTQGCDGGSGAGCTNLGYLYEVGQGVPSDFKEAARLYEKGCAQGQGVGCANLSGLYRRGQGVPKSAEKAAAYHAKGCEAGNASSCNRLGHRYSLGRGVPEDHARAATLYQKACDGEDAAGCRRLGLAYRDAQDHSRAAALFEKACNAGDAIGCTRLGLLYGSGQGVPHDDPRAFGLFKQGCDGGDTKGCGNLGVMYGYGLGVTKDLAQAVTLYKKACDAGDMFHCANLGSMYQEGKGVTRDDDRAETLMEKACEAGEPYGCYRLGFLYDIHARDDAAENYQKACDGGYMAGCGDLGWIYKHGEGVERDLARAATLYQKACDAGLMNRCNDYGDLLSEDRDHGQAVRLYKKACDADHALACENLAENYLYAHGVPQSEEMAKKLLKKACDLGRACKEVVKKEEPSFNIGFHEEKVIPIKMEEPIYLNIDAPP